MARSNQTIEWTSMERLFQRLRDDVEDDAAWQVLADWLRTRDDPRAELIDLDRSEADTFDLRTRRRALDEAVRTEPQASAPQVRLHWHRGFVVGCELDLYGDVAARLEPLLSAHPLLTHVRCHLGSNLSALTACEGIEQIQSLNLGHTHLDPAHTPSLVAFLERAQPRRLDLPLRYSDVARGAFLRTPALATLDVLRNVRVGHDELAHSALRARELGVSGIDAKGFAAFTGSPVLAACRTLRTFGWDAGGAEGERGLSSMLGSEAAANLQSLQFLAGPPDIERIARSLEGAALPHLRALIFCGAVSTEALRSVAQRERPSLEHLTVSTFPQALDDSTLLSLAESSAFPALQSLHLMRHETGWNGSTVRSLVQADAWPRLTQFFASLDDEDPGPPPDVPRGLVRLSLPNEPRFRPWIDATHRRVGPRSFYLLSGHQGTRWVRVAVSTVEDVERTFEGAIFYERDIEICTVFEGRVVERRPADQFRGRPWLAEPWTLPVLPAPRLEDLEITWLVEDPPDGGSREVVHGYETRKGGPPRWGRDVLPPPS